MQKQCRWHSIWARQWSVFDLHMFIWINENCTVLHGPCTHADIRAHDAIHKDHFVVVRNSQIQLYDMKCVLRMFWWMQKHCEAWKHKTRVKFIQIYIWILIVKARMAQLNWNGNVFSELELNKMILQKVNLRSFVRFFVCSFFIYIYFIIFVWQHQIS